MNLSKAVIVGHTQIMKKRKKRKENSLSSTSNPVSQCVKWQEQAAVRPWFTSHALKCSVSAKLKLASPPPTRFLSAPTMLYSPAFLSQLLATFLIQFERLRGVQSSGVLFIFWFLSVLCAIVPFRSKILQASSKVRIMPLTSVTALFSVLHHPHTFLSQNSMSSSFQPLCHLWITPYSGFVNNIMPWKYVQ